MVLCVRVFCSDSGFVLVFCGGRRGFSVGGREQHPGTPLRAKAAETGVLFEWARTMLAKFGTDLPYFQNLTISGNALHTWLECTRNEPLVLSASGCQTLKDCATRHVLHAARACIGFVPKHHFFAEMSVFGAVSGKPKSYSPWRDEGLNLKLREAAAAAHATKQEQRVFHWLSLQGSFGITPQIWGDQQVARDLGFA